MLTEVFMDKADKSRLNKRLLCAEQFEMRLGHSQPAIVCTHVPV